MTSENTTKELQNLPLKELKLVGKRVGVRGTTSRTKYSKHNRSKLIEDILEKLSEKAITTPLPPSDDENEEEETTSPTLQEEEDDTIRYVPHIVSSLRETPRQRERTKVNKEEEHTTTTTLCGP